MFFVCRMQIRVPPRRVQSRFLATGSGEGHHPGRRSHAIHVIAHGAHTAGKIGHLLIHASDATVHEAHILPQADICVFMRCIDSAISGIYTMAVDIVFINPVISESTDKSHIGTLFDILNAHSRTESTRRADQFGIIQQRFADPSR